MQDHEDEIEEVQGDPESTPESQASDDAESQASEPSEQASIESTLESQASDDSETPASEPGEQDKTESEEVQGDTESALESYISDDSGAPASEPSEQTESEIEEAQGDTESAPAPHVSDDSNTREETTQSDASEQLEESEVEPREKIEIPRLKQIVEGAILAAQKPLNVENLLGLFEEDHQPSRADVRAALEEIQDDFSDRGFELKQVASGYRFQVRHEYSDWIGRLWDERPPRYTRAFLETLALIAYKQPITRGDIEEIRGVTVSTNIMRSLLEREWIRIVGHRDVPGRPAIYATTREFLDYFDLSNLDQLPSLAEIKDLDGVNEELDLSDALIEPRTLSLNEEDATDADANAEAAEASLEEVTAQVNQIQENIKNVFREPEEDELDLGHVPLAAEPKEQDDTESDVSADSDVEVDMTKETDDLSGAKPDQGPDRQED